MNKKTIASLAYKTLLSLIILAGILMRAGLFSQSLQLQTLYSFTTISNFFVLAATATTIAKIAATGGFCQTLANLRTIALMAILLTGLIYHFLLLPEKQATYLDYNVFAFGNIATHYIAPIGMLLDWLLFDEKGRIGKWIPLAFTAVPLLYFVAASVYGALGPNIPGKDTSYVYFFMDWGKLGAAGVLAWAALLLAGVLCLTYGIYFLDRFLAKRAAGKSSL